MQLRNIFIVNSGIYMGHNIRRANDRHGQSRTVYICGVEIFARLFIFGRTLDLSTASATQKYSSR